VWLYEDHKSQMDFNGKVQKLCSVLASTATAAFTRAVINTEGDFSKYAERMPVFDCRVFQLPNKEEATACFLWREIDATKNAISSAARYYFSHKKLQNKSGPEMQEMMFQEHGVNFIDYPDSFKRGTYVKRFLIEKPNPIDPEKTVLRSSVSRFILPKLSTIANRVDVIFDGVEPVVYTADLPGGNDQ